MVLNMLKTKTDLYILTVVFGFLSFFVFCKHFNNWCNRTDYFEQFPVTWKVKTTRLILKIGRKIKTMIRYLILAILLKSLSVYASTLVLTPPELAETLACQSGVCGQYRFVKNIGIGNCLVQFPKSFHLH